MRFLAFCAVFLLLASLSFSYQLTKSREEMLAYYYSNIDGKLPKSMKMLIGDEKANVYIGGKVLGIETRGGELQSFELYAVENPGIIIRVSDDAAEKIAKKQLGVLAAIEDGGITIEGKGWYATFKVEVLKRLYAVAKIDDIVLGKKPASASGEIYNSYVQKAKIVNCFLFFC